MIDTLLKSMSLAMQFISTIVIKEASSSPHATHTRGEDDSHLIILKKKKCCRITNICYVNCVKSNMSKLRKV